MVSSIDGFYKIVHLATILIVVSFIFYVWRKYLAISPDKNEKTSNSLLFFAAALLLWEYNLFDTDLQYELFSTIIVNGLLLIGITYFNDGVLMIRTKSRYRAVKTVPVVSVLLIVLTHFLFKLSQDFSFKWLGYLPGIGYTLFTMCLLAYGLLIYFYKRKFLWIGIAACIFLTGIFISSFLPVVIHDNSNLDFFIRTKAAFLISSMGVFMIMMALIFNFINDLRSKQLSRIYTGPETPDAGSSIEELDAPSMGQQVQGLVAQDKIEEIIELLLNHFRNDQSQLQTVLLLANQLTALNTSRLRGIVNNEEYQRSRSVIVERVLILTK